MESDISGDAVLKTEKTEDQLAECNVDHSVKATIQADFSDGRVFGLTNLAVASRREQW
jgi:hypothetical protein